MCSELSVNKAPKGPTQFVEVGNRHERCKTLDGWQTHHWVDLTWQLIGWVKMTRGGEETVPENATSRWSAFDPGLLLASTTNKKGQQRHGHLNWRRWKTCFRGALSELSCPLHLQIEALLSVVVSITYCLLLLEKIGWCYLQDIFPGWTVVSDHVPRWWVGS